MGILRAVLLKAPLLHKLHHLQGWRKSWWLFCVIASAKQCSCKRVWGKGKAEAVTQQGALSNQRHALLWLIYLAAGVPLSTCLCRGFRAQGGGPNLCRIRDGCHFIRYRTRVPREVALQLVAAHLKTNVRGEKSPICLRLEVAIKSMLGLTKDLPRLFDKHCDFW